MPAGSLDNHDGEGNGSEAKKSKHGPIRWTHSTWSRKGSPLRSAVHCANITVEHSWIAQRACQRTRKVWRTFVSVKSIIRKQVKQTSDILYVISERHGGRTCWRRRCGKYNGATPATNTMLFMKTLQLETADKYGILTEFHSPASGYDGRMCAEVFGDHVNRYPLIWT